MQRRAKDSDTWGLEKLCVPTLSVMEQGRGWAGNRGNVSTSFPFAFQVKNPAPQREVANVPTLRDAPGFELWPGVLPGSSLVTPVRAAPAGGVAQGPLGTSNAAPPQAEALSVKGLRSVSLFCAVSSGFSLVPLPPLLLEHLRFPGRMQRCLISACPALAPSLTLPVLPVRAGSAAAPLLQSPATAQVTGKGRSTPGTPRPHPCHARGPTRGCLCTKVGNSLLKTQPNRVPRCPNLPEQGAVGTGGSAQLSSALLLSPRSLLSPSNPPVMLRESLQRSPEFPQLPPWCKAIHQGTQTARLLKATP